jgi:hypothetical protein
MSRRSICRRRIAKKSLSTNNEIAAEQRFCASVALARLMTASLNRSISLERMPKPLIVADRTCLEDACRRRFLVAQSRRAPSTTLVRQFSAAEADYPNVVHRWASCGPVHNLGLRFIELAGLDEINGYFR